MRPVARLTATILLVGGIVISGSTGSATAATRFVAVNGADGPSCGTKAAPCRSIGRGIANAAPGDTLVVGPGRYGDLDLDGAFTGPGEEGLGDVNCMIRVDKPLTILSRDGAAATVLHAGNAPSSFAAPVCLVVSGVKFGKPRKGFTLTGAMNRPGLQVGVDTIDVTTTDVVVSGNRSTMNLYGFAIAGTGNVVQGNQAVGNGGINNGTGFGTGFLVNQGAQVLSANLSAGNGDTGFFVLSAATGTQLRGDVAVGNGGIGFQFNPAGSLTGCVAAGNGGDGFDVVGASTLTKSAAIGNAGAGVFLIPGPSVSKCTFVGNGTKDGMHCGVNNVNAGTVNATNVFWGAPTGPGTTGADAACATGGPIQTTPFATKEIRVRPKLPPID